MFNTNEFYIEEEYIPTYIYIIILNNKSVK